MENKTAMQVLIEYMDNHSMKHTGVYAKALSLRDKEEREQLAILQEYREEVENLKTEIRSILKSVSELRQAREKIYELQRKIRHMGTWEK